MAVAAEYLALMVAPEGLTVAPDPLVNETVPVLYLM